MDNKKKINLVLFEPEIPQNTGNIFRTAIGTDCLVHLIKPLGFSLEDKYLRRSALDYIKDINYYIYENYQEFVSMNPGTYFFLTRYGQKPLTSFDFTKIEGPIYLLFGKESTGIPYDILNDNMDSLYRIPHNDKIRSLNLANCVAISIYEVLRQLNYPNLSKAEPESLKGKDFLTHKKGG